jgi:hypothetical protein
MFLPLLGVASLGIVPPPPTAAVCPMVHTAPVRPEPVLLPQSRAPGERRRRQRGQGDPEDDRDEEGGRTLTPPAGFVPPTADAPHPVRGPQLPGGPGSRFALVPLIYALCTLLL